MIYSFENVLIEIKLYQSSTICYLYMAIYKEFIMTPDFPNKQQKLQKIINKIKSDSPKDQVIL